MLSLLSAPAFLCCFLLSSQHVFAVPFPFVEDVQSLEIRDPKGFSLGKTSSHSIPSLSIPKSSSPAPKAPSSPVSSAPKSPSVASPPTKYASYADAVKKGTPASPASAPKAGKRICKRMEAGTGDCVQPGAQSGAGPFGAETDSRGKTNDDKFIMYSSRRQTFTDHDAHTLNTENEKQRKLAEEYHFKQGGNKSNLPNNMGTLFVPHPDGKTKGGFLESASSGRKQPDNPDAARGPHREQEYGAKTSGLMAESTTRQPPKCSGPHSEDCLIPNMAETLGNPNFKGGKVINADMLTGQVRPVCKQCGPNVASHDIEDLSKHFMRKRSLSAKELARRRILLARDLRRR